MVRMNMDGITTRRDGYRLTLPLLPMKFTFILSLFYRDRLLLFRDRVSIMTR